MHCWKFRGLQDAAGEDRRNGVGLDVRESAEHFLFIIWNAKIRVKIAEPGYWQVGGGNKKQLLDIWWCMS